MKLYSEIYSNFYQYKILCFHFTNILLSLPSTENRVHNVEYFTDFRQRYHKRQNTEDKLFIYAKYPVILYEGISFRKYITVPL